MTDELAPLVCTWCESEYPCDAETLALQDDEAWQADYCPECRKLHFPCAECGDVTHVDDAHKTHTTLCESCGDNRVEEEEAEALEASGNELQELTDALVESGDIAAIRAAVNALKAIQATE